MHSKQLSFRSALGITPEALANIPYSNAVIAELRRATLALGGPEAPSPELEFKFPKHVYSD